MGAREGLDERGRGLIDCMYVYCRGAAGGEKGCGGCGKGKDVGYMSFRMLDPQSSDEMFRVTVARDQATKRPSDPSDRSIVATFRKAKESLVREERLTIIHSMRG